MSAGSSAVVGLDHVQLAMPPGEEARARAFYGDVLGLRETAKPPALVARGGVWFACGAQMLHLGIERDFRPSPKAHPALLVRGLDSLRAHLVAAGAPVIDDALLPGMRRLYSADPFGNRLELLEFETPAAKPFAGDTAGATAAAIAVRVRATFGPAAEAYVSSPGHASGADLARLVTLATPRPSDVALDLSTGGGHVALALAPRVARVVALDLTPRMLATARAHVRARGVSNVEYVIGAAEQLPFLDETFDVITVRIAPHHYADVPVALGEVLRVLVPGGRFLLEDSIAPDDPHLDALMNGWERWRDPSRVRAYTRAEWQAMLASAGLRITDVETGRKRHPFAEWTARTRMPQDAREALATDMLTAPAVARGYFGIVAHAGTVEAWETEHIIVRAMRPDSRAMA